MLDIQQVAKNRQHFGKNRHTKSCEKFVILNIRRTFVLGNGNETETAKLIDNTESENASRDGVAF